MYIYFIYVGYIDMYIQNNYNNFYNDSNQFMFTALFTMQIISKQLYRKWQA